MERLLVIGPGRVGLALGYALWQADAVRHLVYCGRRPDPPSHPLFGQGIADWHFGLMPPPPGTEAVVLTVPDEVLPEMAHALAAQGRPASGVVALHTSGALGSDVLAPLHAVGYAVGTLHPLQSVAHPGSGAERPVGAGFAASGEPPARAVARRMDGAMEGHVLEVPAGRRPLVHAASAMASSGVAALLATCTGLLGRAGADADEALAVLLPLVRGTLDDVERQGLAQGLGGPVVEGDVEAVDLHLRALDGDEREGYRAVSRLLVGVAEARGLPDDVAGALRTLLRPREGAPLQETT